MDQSNVDCNKARIATAGLDQSWWRSLAKTSGLGPLFFLFDGLISFFGDKETENLCINV